MRRRGWRATWSIGVTACFLAGCLRTLPPDARESRGGSPPRGQEETTEPVTTTKQSLSDYQVMQVPPLKSSKSLAVQPVKETQLRIHEEAEPPVRPADLPAPRLEMQPAPPPPRLDPPSVAALRALLEHHPDDEVRERLKGDDPATRELKCGLLDSIAQLDRCGGIAHLSPQRLADFLDHLNALTTPLRPRAQLMLERMCFCHSIASFGKYHMRPLNPPSFHPGEEARVYLQVRNFASQQEGEFHKTILKAKLEIYDENNRTQPFYCANIKPRCDFSRAPRQDFFVNIRFDVPRSCPPGSYTLWITLEDWTDAPEGTKAVAKSRIDRKSLDFRVGGPAARPLRAGAAEAAPAR